jgi:CTP synthase
MANDLKVEFVFVNSEEDFKESDLEDADGIVVPGGFGARGIEGKLSAIRFARIHKIPFLGICFGMQLAVIEACRNLLSINDASSTEFGATSAPVVGLLTEWFDGTKIQVRDTNTDLGGTMRLGAYPCVINKESLAFQIYKKEKISERHRHRYEVNINYKDQLSKIGMIFSGVSPDGNLPEIIEYADHPWFVAVQFHPELKSRPFDPHPLFKSFIKASYTKGLS